MKLIKVLSVIACAISLMAAPAIAAEGDKAADKTCCEKASAEGKECTHKCCVAAHKDGKSCEKCNPEKQDLKLKKAKKKKKDEAAPAPQQ
jgi:hypothetical protein